MIGQALHRDLSTAQMAKGEHVSFREEGSEAEEFTMDDSYLLAKSGYQFAFIVALSVFLLTIALRCRWLSSILISVAIFICMPLVAMIFVGGDLFFRIWRRKHHTGDLT
jgi:type IV secretory pathway component VirB8